MDEQTLAIIAEYEGMEPTADYAEEVMDRYLGEAETARDWAEQYFEDTGMLAGLAPVMQYYFAYGAWVHDEQLGGGITVVPVPGGVVVLHN